MPEAARDTRYKGEGLQFTATGTSLPNTDKTEADLQGKWVKSKYGLQFQVESCEEILPQTKEGIRDYLSSGMIKGIGPKTAELIVEKFGTRTFDVLDHYPDSLLEIKGITRTKLDAILLSYQGRHAMRDLAAYLAPFKVTPKKIQKIYEEFGNDALDIVKNQPFSLCRIVTSFDPIYQFTREDYERGRAQGRYRFHELPAPLPVRDQTFDIGLSSHFLLMYDGLGLDFHIRAITEMLRVYKEVRIFPIVDLDAKPSELTANVIKYAGRGDRALTVCDRMMKADLESASLERKK